MNWIDLKNETQLDEIQRESEQKTVLIFKHSTSCSISATAIHRLERSWKPEEMTHVKAYYLDLLSHRNVSRRIADFYGIMHESPQLLLIEKGACVYHASHLGISYPNIRKNVLE